MGERCLEGGDALALQGAADVVEVDACSRQRAHVVLGRCDVDVDHAGEGAVVLERLQGALRQGVDGVGPDQVVDVQRVGVVGVLGRRRCPQRPLHPGAAVGQPFPPRSGVGLAEELVGELGLGDRGSTAQRERLVGADRLQTSVDLGVDPADEERRHAVDGGEIFAAVGEGLQAREVGLEDLAVAGQGEDQSDVDAAALRDHRLDSGHAGGRGRDLDQQVGLLDAFVQVSGGLDGRPSVVGQLGRHLDRDEPVGTLAGVEGRPQQPQGVDDVGDDEVPVGVLHGVSSESSWSCWS